MALPPHLTNPEARMKKLPGCDVFKPMEIAYVDPLNAMHAMHDLNSEALKAFNDCIIINERDYFKEEAAAWKALNDSLKDVPFDEWRFIKRPPTKYTFNLGRFLNFEYLKIAAGFEIHLKARLLNAGYIVHIIENVDSFHNGGTYKHLHRKQKNTPITIDELKAVDDFRYDGTINYLPGISAESLKFSWLTQKPDYQRALSLTENEMNEIDRLRTLRNQIHLPRNMLGSTGMQPEMIALGDFIVSFVNKNIVEWTNNIIDPKMERLTAI